MDDKLKILVVKLGALGDVLASTPVFKALNEERKEILHHLVFDECAVVTRNNPYIGKVISVRNFGRNSLVRKISFLISYFSLLMFGGYDRVYVLANNPYLKLVAYLVYGRRVFSYFFKIFYCKLIDGPLFNPIRSQTLRELDIVANSGLRNNFDTKLEFYSTGIEGVNFAINKPYIVINPGAGNLMASGHNKRWPALSFAKLIEKLKIQVVLVGAGKDDEAVAEKITNMCNSHIINLVNKTKFEETSSILQGSELFIGNDSSLLYLCEAMSVKAIGIYGPTSSDIYRPLGNFVHPISSSYECAPCYDPLDGIDGVMYKCQRNRCMENITVESVFNKVMELIK